MEAIALKILELIWDKTDPALAICIIILGYWIYKSNKRHEAALEMINKKIDDHLNPETRHPHASCQLGEQSYKTLCSSLERQHTENRDDHKLIFTKLDDLKK